MQIGKLRKPRRTKVGGAADVTARLAVQETAVAVWYHAVAGAGLAALAVAVRPMGQGAVRDGFLERTAGLVPPCGFLVFYGAYCAPFAK